MMHTPAIVLWARAGYWASDRFGRENLKNLFKDGYSISALAAEYLLTTEPENLTIDHDEGTVVFEWPDEIDPIPRDETPKL